MVQVTSLGIMHSLKNCEEGELCYVHNEEKTFRYVNNEWVEVEIPKGEFHMNMYDMNKNLIGELAVNIIPEGKEKIEDVVLDCINCFGATIKSIDTLDDAIEIWIQKDDEAYVMYFFNYDGGVEICAI